MPGGRGRKPSANRTDLLVKNQPKQVPTGLAYGEAKQLQQTQNAQPLPAPQQPPVSLEASAHQAATAAPPPQSPIHAPTNRPGEPLTTGLATGPGAGPEVLAGGGAIADPTMNVLQGIYSRWPSEDMRALLMEAQSRAGMASGPTPPTGP